MHFQGFSRVGNANVQRYYSLTALKDDVACRKSKAKAFQPLRSQSNY
jgi:hypothetical protein